MSKEQISCSQQASLKFEKLNKIRILHVPCKQKLHIFTKKNSYKEMKKFLIAKKRDSELTTPLILHQQDLTIDEYAYRMRRSINDTLKMDIQQIHRHIITASQ